MASRPEGPDSTDSTDPTGYRRAGPAQAPVSSEERKALIDALSEHFAADRLSVEEFESRIDRAHRAEHKSDLDVLVADLAGGAEPQKENAAPGGSSTPSPEGAGAGKLSQARGRVPAPMPQEIRKAGRDICVWGGRSRTGTWTPARRHTAVAVQGGVELDFREARMDAGVYDLRAVAVMGAVEVVVPPDLRVETEGSAVLGSFEHEASGGDSAWQGPLLRIGGFAFMGSVEITVMDPGTPLEEGGSR